MPATMLGPCKKRGCRHGESEGGACKLLIGELCF